MKLRHMKMHGITRFRRPVAVDFEALGPGVFAIAGPNGSGKTTLLESTAPGVFYRELPTREPSGIQHWVRPQGGRIEVAFSVGAGSYQAVLEIAANGRQTAYLDGDAGPLASGKVSDYDQAIRALLGPSSAMYASVFGAQGGGGRFSALSVSDRKSLFRFYLGLDRLEVIHTACKTRLSGCAEDAAAAQRFAEEVVSHEADLAHLRTDLVAALATAEATRKEATRTRTEAEAVADLVARAEAVRDYRAALQAIATAEERFRALASAAPQPPAEERPDIAAAETALREAEALAEALERDRRAADAVARQEERAKDALRTATRAAALLADVPCGGEAPYDGCPLLRDATAASRSLAVLRGEAERWSAQVAAAASIQTPAPDTRLLREAVRRAVTAQTTWDRAQDAVRHHARSVADAKVVVVERREHARALRARLPGELPSELPAVEELRTARARAAVAEEDASAASTAVVRFQTSIERLERDLATTKEAEAGALTRAADYPALSLLAKALGPSGIQAYEIDAAGPHVSEVATTLLDACYGDRFTVEVRTLRELRSKEGVAEDFSVHVIDRRRGGERTLAGLSGGEQVVVDEALRTALSLFAAERGASPWKTMFRDETVGALDPDNAAAYVRMLHRARELGGYHQVLYVTHDERAIGAADAVIRITEGGDVRVER